MQGRAVVILSPPQQAKDLRGQTIQPGDSSSAAAELE
jgi:hypothetical protein